MLGGSTSRVGGQSAVTWRTRGCHEGRSRRATRLETFEAETTRHEKVFLLDADGPEPLMVYVMDVDDPQHAAAAFADSRLPIDVRHKEVMAEVDAGRAEVESLLDISADREAS